MIYSIFSHTRSNSRCFSRKHWEFAKKKLKPSGGVSLGEEVRKLQSRRDERKRDRGRLQMLVNKVTINLNMFRPLMKDSIVGILNSTAFITIERGRRRLRDTQIKQETTKPNNLSSGMSHSTILSFGSRASNDWLFLTFPRDQGITKKHTKTRRRLAISNITSSIRVSIGHQVQRGSRGH